MKGFDLELSLELLERDDLGRRGDGDPEDLPQQRRPPHRSQRKQVASNGGLDDGIAHVGCPASRVVPEAMGARVGSPANPGVHRLLFGQAERGRQRARRPVRQRQLLEPAGKTLARAPGQPERGRPGGDDMNRDAPSPQPIPFALQPRRPISQDVRLIEEDGHAALGAGDRFCSCPDPFPEPRQGSLRAVARRVERCRAGLPLELEQECRLSHLAGPREELDPGGRLLGQALPDQPAAALVVHGSNYTRIIIRLRPGHEESTQERQSASCRP